MRTLTFATLSCALTLMLGLAIAESASAQDRARPSEENETHYTFTDELVRGDMVRPDGWVVNARRRRPTTTLIRIRDNFVGELYKSVENI